jgi:murein DD-endopeptidase MepM/ murein hydrolase activator NlpD
VNRTPPSPRLRAGLTLTGALAVALFAASALPAVAQEPPPESTTTTTDSTTTTVAETTTTVPGDPSTTTTTTLPPPPAPPDPGAGEEIVPEPVPAPEVVVPPAVAEGPYAGQPPFATFVGRVVSVDVLSARLASEGAQAALASARANRERLETEVASLIQQLSEGASRYLRIAQRLAAADLALRERAVEAYLNGGYDREALPSLLDSANATDFASRRALMNGLIAGDQDTIARYQRARDRAADDQVEAARTLADLRSELDQAVTTEQQAEFMVRATAFEVAVTSAGGSMVIHGFGFPVADPHSFIDSFGAPRMTGTPYAHWHEGTDIFAPAGTPLIAAERGVITRMGQAVLGGTVVWLKGESGTSYYYAHLSGYAPGITAGMLVEAGTIIGYVGNTGNAATTPPHLHFEIHPGGGGPINPYPLLVVADSYETQTQPG